MNVASSASMNFNNTVTLADGTVNVAASFNADTVTQSGGVTTINGTANITNLAINEGWVQGTGTIMSTGGVANTGGTVHPGNSPGVLTIAGNYTQSGGVLLITVIGPTLGSGFSRLAVSGTATLGGRLQVANPYTVNKTMRVVTASAVTGTFGEILFTGQRYTTSYDATGVTLTPIGGGGHATAGASSADAGQSGAGEDSRRQAEHAALQPGQGRLGDRAHHPPEWRGIDPMASATCTPPRASGVT